MRTKQEGGAGMQEEKHVIKVVKEEDLPIHGPAPRMTHEQLQREYNYIVAEQITKKMLDKGLITEDEYKKIMKENRKTFKPFLAPLMPDD